MQPHQQRVVDEQAELDTKIEALTGFVTTPLFASLDSAERTRLNRQLVVMNEYSDILSERIAEFK